MTDPNDDPVRRLSSQAPHRRQSAQSDLAALLLEELRALEGVHIPAHAEMAAHGLLRAFGRRFYAAGQRLAQDDAEAARRRLAEAEAQAVRYEADLRSLRFRVLEAGRDEITIRDLVNEVLGGRGE